MTEILDELLNQTAVYWAPNGTDEYGQRTYADPVELSCQWENTVQTLNTAEGKQLTITATVFLKTEVVQDGILQLSTLATAPATPPETQRIKQVLSFQDVDNDEQMWKAIL